MIKFTKLIKDSLLLQNQDLTNLKIIADKLNKTLLKNIKVAKIDFLKDNDSYSTKRDYYQVVLSCNYEWKPGTSNWNKHFVEKFIYKIYFASKTGTNCEIFIPDGGYFPFNSEDKSTINKAIAQIVNSKKFKEFVEIWQNSLKKDSMYFLIKTK